MATRRQRPSLDAVAGSNNAVKSSTLEAFEDFRRRHSRQNKDIVIDNALRRTTVKSLQDEIAKLHVELLELRQANVLLTTQVKRLKSEASRSCNHATRDAIDQILGAIPALRQFRDSLGSSSESPLYNPSETDEVRSWNLESTENPTATRPAAFGKDLSRQANLAPLVEMSEYGSDDGETLSSMIDTRKIRRMSKGRRRTEIGSVALRSPRPNTRLPPSDYFVVDTPPSPRRSASPIQQLPSPSSSLSDSPSPVKRSSPEKRRKQRRESGRLAPIIARALSPVSPIEADNVEDIPDWVEDENVIVASTRVDTVQAQKDKSTTVKGARIKEIADALAANAVAGPSKRIMVETTTGLPERPDGNLGDLDEAKALSPMPLLVETSRIASTPSRASSVESIPYTDAGSVMSIGDDDARRGRRSRKSVSYKEPSLTKKMRKPDGVTIEDTLRLPRQSLSLSNGLLPPDTPGSVPDSSVGLKSVHSRRALQHLSGPRRKSVLPKPGSSYQSPTFDEDEDAVEDGIDVQLDLDNDLDGRSTPSDGETTADDHLPSNPTTPTESISPPSKPAPPRRSVVGSRSSPEKAPTRPGSVTANRIRTVGASKTPSVARTALTERPDENGRRVKLGAVAIKGAPVARRPISTTGRKASA